MVQVIFFNYMMLIIGFLQHPIFVHDGIIVVEEVLLVIFFMAVSFLGTCTMMKLVVKCDVFALISLRTD